MILSTISLLFSTGYLSGSRINIWS